MAGPSEQAGDVTRLLRAVGGGQTNALDDLMPLVYGELKRVAERQIRRERPGHSLGASGLVNEAFLKLVDQAQVDWQCRQHFFGVAARAMRQVLVDYARKRNAEKRGGDWNRTSLDENGIGFQTPLADLLALDQALNRLDQISSRMRQVVEYRYYCGLSEDETAELLGVTKRTIQREWAKARAWLYKELYQKD